MFSSADEANEQKNARMAGEDEPIVTSPPEATETAEPPRVDMEAELSRRPAPPPTEAETPFPLAEAGEYYSGMWGSIPLYACPFCHFTALSKEGKESGDGQIEFHILGQIDAGNTRHMAALDDTKGDKA